MRCLLRIGWSAWAFVFSLSFALGQEYTLSGYIEDSASKEKLISANVFDKTNGTGTISNNFGFYSYTAETGIIEVEFSYIGYESQTLTIDLKEDTDLGVLLKANGTLTEIEINAERTKRIQEESQMSTIELPVAQIKRVPALLGEVDVLKALQLLPGIQSGGEGQSGLYVRGGSPDQNLILLDGVPVYNASHLFGFFSVFNADAIKDVKLIKGGFPARYGGRLSSVLEINMKEGNMNKFRGSGAIGLVSSKLTLEGPILKDKTSFIVSGRRTYIDVLTQPFIRSSARDRGEDLKAGYYFYDLNAKINHKFSNKDRLYLSFYSGKDKFYLSSKEREEEIKDFTNTGLGWGNVTSALRWNHIITPKLFSNLTASISNYRLITDLSVGSDYPSVGEEGFFLQYDSGIRDYALRWDLDFVPMPNHYLKFGAHYIRHKFNPGTFDLEFKDPLGEDGFSDVIRQNILYADEMSVYIEDDMKVTPRLKVNAGLHFSGFSVPNKFYTSVQPRISGRYLLDEYSSVKASFATMRQYIHLLAYEGIGLPTDLWLPTTERVRPQHSWQVAVGYARTLFDEYEVSVEGYYKNMKDVISYKDGAGVFELSDWQDRVTQGEGTSYGAEFLLQKKFGRFNGWIGYTLSWSDRQFDEINGGKKFPYRYDRRHDLSVVANYEWTDRISISGAWVFGSGNAVTFANGQYRGINDLISGYPSDFDGEYFDDRNNYRMRSYHRFDVGINFTKENENFSRTWSVGAYNAYNRKNPFFVYSEIDNEFDPNTGTVKQEYKLKQASLFPVIPYVTYSFKF